ncbi:MAG: O-antigen ligase family protein [Magnetospirillum sp.]|nr:O-antigen ligase family protein [Magnetospirillum sp.]
MTRMGGYALALATLVAPTVLSYANRGMVLLIAATALACLPGLVRDRIRPNWRSPVGGLIAAFLAWGALTALWAYTPGLALPKAAGIGGLALAGLVLTMTAGRLDTDERRRVLKAALLGMAIATVLVGIERLLDLPLSRGAYWLESGKWVEGPLFVITRFKPTAILLVVWTVLAAPAAYALGWRRTAIVSIAVAVAVSVVTGSLGALLAIGMTTVVSLLVLYGSPRLATRTMAVALAVAFAAAPLAVAIPEPLAMWQAAPWLPHSTQHRAQIWKFAAERTVERPLLGWGLDGSRRLPGGDAKVANYYDIPGRAGEVEIQPQPVMPLHPHNAISQVWLETGAVGAGLALAVVIALLLPAGRLNRLPALVVIGGTTATMTVSAVSFGAWQSWWHALLWLTVALAVTARDIATLKA